MKTDDIKINYIKSWLPFKGKMKLPSQMELLKLVLFLRDEAGTNNHGVSAGGIYNSVAEIVQKYWAWAGFITQEPVTRAHQYIWRMKIARARGSPRQSRRGQCSPGTKGTSG